MRIIKEKYLRDSAAAYPKAEKYLNAWTRIVRTSRWKSMADLRRTYPTADPVWVSSGKRVIVFNVCGNTYRLVVAMHFDRQIACTLRFMTHGEYSRGQWKDEL